MNLEKEVCDLEYAKELKELGIPQESLFYWSNFIVRTFEVTRDNWARSRHPQAFWSAFTATELIADLPQRITINENEPFNSFSLVIDKRLISEDGKIFVYVYCVDYQCDTFDTNKEMYWFPPKLFQHAIHDKKFANALAKTMIHIIKNKLI